MTTQVDDKNATAVDDDEDEGIHETYNADDLAAASGDDTHESVIKDDTTLPDKEESSDESSDSEDESSDTGDTDTEVQADVEESAAKTYSDDLLEIAHKWGFRESGPLDAKEFVEKQWNITETLKDTVGLLRDEVREAVTKVLGYFRGYLKIPGIRTWAANWWLEYAWKQARPFIPQDHLEELRGLADGSGVSLEDLYRLHAVPDRTYSCSSFAAWGRATADGRLIHVRNLDWSIKAGIQQFPVIFVVRPKGKHAFVNIGWAGFVGVLTGINDAQISIGQVGAETTDDGFRGEPMVFLMRRVLETADDLDAAADVFDRFFLNARKSRQLSRLNGLAQIRDAFDLQMIEE